MVFLSVRCSLPRPETPSAQRAREGYWPHPRMEGAMPDAGHLLDLFNAWTPDDAIRRRILVDNPARLYDFPR